MARHAFALLCFIGLGLPVIFANIPDYKTIYVEVNDERDIGRADENYSDVKFCNVILNNGTKYQIYPESDKSEIRRKFYSSYERCATKINRIEKSDEGLISIETTVQVKDKKPEVKKSSYYLKVLKTIETKKPLPASENVVYPGQQVSARFDEEFPDLDSCKVLDPNNIEYDLDSHQYEPIKKSGKCGVKITVDKGHSGTWNLIAYVKKNDTAYMAPFKVNVKDPKELISTERNYFYKAGRQVNILGGDQNAKMCFLEDPYGKRFPIQPGTCSHTIDHVTKYHEGVWKAHYGLEGVEELIVQNITVQTYEVSEFNSSVSHSDGKINLLCRYRSNDVRFCNFIKPDGEVLLMTVGVGNGKYDYYGNGKQEHSTGSDTDCGVTIVKPEAHDYGVWKCVMRIGESNEVGAVLKVTPSSRATADMKSDIVANSVYTKKGESFKVACSAGEVLSYCWFRSPNGTVHRVFVPSKPTEDVNAPSLKYAGTSLEMGDCTAEVKDANYTHAGEWSCHMGILNGPEVDGSFKVIVEETHLMAARDVVVLDNSDTTDLICRPLPESNKIIKSCRWINPTGRGVNVEHHGRYLTETSLTDCKLSIKVINFSEDLGKWTCYASFANSNEEASAEMVVTSSRGLALGSFLSISLVITLLVCISISVFVLIVYKRRVALARLEEKIILEKPARYP